MKKILINLTTLSMGFLPLVAVASCSTAINPEVTPDKECPVDPSLELPKGSFEVTSITEGLNKTTTEYADKREIWVTEQIKKEFGNDVIISTTPAGKPDILDDSERLEPKFKTGEENGKIYKIDNKNYFVFEVTKESYTARYTSVLTIAGTQSIKEFNVELPSVKHTYHMFVGNSLIK